jgi:AAA family ATP:ADP antiporter
MSIKTIWKNLSPEFKKNTLLVFLAYFFLLFSYPLIRSATGSLFLEFYKAKNMPLSWLIAIITLSGTILLCNKIQFKKGVHFVYSLISLFSFIFFIIGLILYNNGWGQMSMYLSIWKEIYIVITIHLLVGYCASFFSIDEAKVLYGPLCAVGSLGGVLGGELTSIIAKSAGTNYVLILGAVLIFIASLIFNKTSSYGSQLFKKEENLSPLSSIKPIKNFVFLLALIIAITQFMISIADLKFNLVFEQMIASTDDRSAYLGWLHSRINLVSLIIQVITVPILLQYFKEKTLHFFIPLFYVGLYLAASFFEGGMLFSIAGVFIILKATDYSLFTVIKELLYLPFTRSQKYGIKYITDMLVYRCAKAIIAIVLIYFQSFYFLDISYYVFGTLWVIVLFFLFRSQKSV